MAKQAKKTQTDYTIGGKQISDTAIPLYTSGLTQMGDLTSNYQDYLDDTIKKYYSNTADQSDFLRNYQRAMANTTANNYAATSGGYSSSGNRAYSDQQRYQNDLASRLQQQGITGAQSILNNQISNLSSALGQYNTAYGLGKDYSDIEQYNYIVDQGNSAGNQLAGMAGGVGKVLSAIPTPWTQAIGAGLQAVGNLASTDTSSALGSGSSDTQSWSTIGSSVGGGLGATAKLGGNNWVTKLYGSSGS